jgi:hypothetical protein
MPAAAPSIACLAPHCTRPACTRGLCATHHRRARERVHRGEVAWEQLERVGRRLPAKPHPWRRRKE